MSETRSGQVTPINTKEFDVISIIKKKVDKIKADLLSVIRGLFHLEVEKP